MHRVEVTFTNKGERIIANETYPRIQDALRKGYEIANSILNRNPHLETYRINIIISKI